MAVPLDFSDFRGQITLGANGGFTYTPPSSLSPGDPLTALLDENTPPSAGTVSLGSDGSFTFTPSHDFNGVTGFTYHLSDGSLTSAVATVTLDVLPVNDPPSFTAGDVATFDNAGPQTLAGWAKNVSAGAADEPSQPLTFEILANTHPALFAAGPSVDAGGRLNFTLAPNVEGSASVTIVLHDGGGTDRGGQDVSQPVTFVIAVTKPHRWHNEMPPPSPINCGGMEVLFEDDAHSITPTDVLLVINYLNAGLPTKIPDLVPIANGTTRPFYDVDGDDSVTPTDALLIINLLNAGQGGPAAGEGEGVSSATPADPQWTLAQLIALLAADHRSHVARRHRQP